MSQDIINSESHENTIISSVEKTAAINFEVIDSIKKLDVITPHQIQQFEKAQSFALSCFRDVPSYRPLIVKITSVLNNKDFPTPDSKYWQCKSEAEVHFNQLTKGYYTYQRALIDLKEISYKIDEINKMLDQKEMPNEKFDPNLITFDKMRLELKRDEYQYDLKLLEKDIKYRIQEVIDWNNISNQLIPQCQYSTTDYQDHTIKSHIAFLQYKINDKDTSDKDKVMFKSQLETFNKNVLNK